MKDDVMSKSVFILIVVVTTLFSNIANAGRGAYLTFFNRTDSTVKVECTGRQGLEHNKKMCRKVDGTVSARSKTGGGPGEYGPLYIEEKKSDSTTHMNITLTSSGLNHSFKIKASGGKWSVVSGATGDNVDINITSASQDHIVIDIGDNSRWVGSLKNKEIPINQLLLMGTHDSGTYKYASHVERAGEYSSMLPIGLIKAGLELADVGQDVKTSFVATQKMNLTNQLKFGVRFLDLRLGCLNEKCETVSLYHGDVALFVHMKSALDDIRSFLQENRDEFVIVSIKNDADNSTDAKGKVTKMVNRYINNNSAYFYDTKSNKYPSVKDVRGKMVIIDRGVNITAVEPLTLDIRDNEVSGCYGYGYGYYDNKAKNNDNDKCPLINGDDKKPADARFKYQDFYSTSSYDKKYNAVRDFAIEKMNKNNFNESYNLNFMSASHWPKSPQDFATHGNGYLSKNATFQTRHAGIFILDFPKYHADVRKNKSRLYSVDTLINRSQENSDLYKK